MYEKAIVEVLEVIDHMEPDVTRKIPPEVIKALIQRMDAKYNFVYDESKNLLIDIKLNEETKEIIENEFIPVEIKFKGILASSRSLLMLTILLTVMNNSKRPKIISKILEGRADATKPPKTPPIRPKIPSLIPGFRILSMVLVCL